MSIAVSARDSFRSSRAPRKILAGAPHRPPATRLGSSRVSRWLPFGRIYVLLHLVDSSREVEDERKRSLSWPQKSAHHLFRASCHLHIGASYYQVTLGKWIRQTLSAPQKLHD